MASTASMINNILDTLEEDDLNAAYSYIQFLAEKSKRKKSIGLLGQMQEMVAEDNPWNSEEVMIKEMAEFRRLRIKS